MRADADDLHASLTAEGPGSRASMTSSAPSTATVVLFLGAGALAVALILGLAALAGPEGSEGVRDWVTSLLVLVIGGASSVAAVQARRALNMTHEVGRNVDVVRSQTNGSLDRRIKESVAAALAEAFPPTPPKRGLFG